MGGYYKLVWTGKLLRGSDNKASVHEVKESKKYLEQKVSRGLDGLL